MPGQCWTKRGVRKLGYGTRADAKRARTRAIERHAGSDPGTPYRCGECGLFHLGHYPTSPAIRAHLRALRRGES